MIHFVGAGPGAPDLITVRGQRLLAEADVIVYAGSLVNPELLQYAKPGCQTYNSAGMTLEQVLAMLTVAHSAGQMAVRLHTGDPSIYGAIREQMDALDALDIPYEVTPGVSSMNAAAAALKAEYTLPEVSQTVIVTRMAGRTPVPEKENMAALAAHHATMVIFLSAGLLESLQKQLMAGGYAPEEPAAIVYKASWPEELVLHCTVGTLAETGRAHGIGSTALVLVGGFLGADYARSKLYDPGFTHGFRQGTDA